MNNDLIFYDIRGEETDIEKNALAKVIKTKSNYRYYISTYNNLPYDPIGTNSHKARSGQVALKKTSRETFIWYIKYLETKNLVYFTRTNRSFLNA